MTDNPSGHDWVRQDVDFCVGKKYGLLTVLSVVSYDYRSDKRGYSKLLCVCDCGKEAIRSMFDLKYEKTKSCGCLHLKNSRKAKKETAYTIEIGRQVSIWTVIKFLRYECGKGNIYLCECRCGELKEQTVRTLRFLELTGSRGRCLHKKYRDKINGKVSTDIHYACLTFFKSCVLCGSKDNLEIDHVNPRSNGGSGKPGNIIVLCRFCNRSKSDRIFEELPDTWQPILTNAALKFESNYLRR